MTEYTYLLDQAPAAGIELYFVKPVNPTVLHDLLSLHATTLWAG